VAHSTRLSLRPELRAWGIFFNDKMPNHRLLGSETATPSQKTFYEFIFFKPLQNTCQKETAAAKGLLFAFSDD
jgi:hypothetical protein